MGAVLKFLMIKMGIIWPNSITPFDVYLIALGSGVKTMEEKLERIQRSLSDFK